MGRAEVAAEDVGVATVARRAEARDRRGHDGQKAARSYDLGGDPTSSGWHGRCSRRGWGTPGGPAAGGDEQRERYDEQSCLRQAAFHLPRDGSTKAAREAVGLAIARAAVRARPAPPAATQPIRAEGAPP